MPTGLSPTREGLEGVSAFAITSVGTYIVLPGSNVSDPKRPYRTVLYWAGPFDRIHASDGQFF